MANHQILNNQDHQSLRIDTRHGSELDKAFGDQVMSTYVFPVEYRHAQAHYPIFFQTQPDSGDMATVALFGFEEGENLFLSEGSWDAGYLPLLIDRLPFLIGPQQGSDMQGDAPQLAIHIDMDSPRVSESEGTPVFLPHGGHSDFINEVASKLQAIHIGQKEMNDFCGALKALDLLESFFLDIKLDTGTTHRMSGYYTINEEKLKGLSAEQAGELHQQGYLQHIYMILASQSSLKPMIERKNKRAAS